MSEEEWLAKKEECLVALIDINATAEDEADAFKRMEPPVNAYFAWARHQGNLVSLRDDLVIAFRDGVPDDTHVTQAMINRLDKWPW